MATKKKHMKDLSVPDEPLTDKEIIDGLGRMGITLSPDLSLLVKLASIVVHAEEVIENVERLGVVYPADRVALQNLLKDGEVQQWIREMGPLAPVKR